MAHGFNAVEITQQGDKWLVLWSPKGTSLVTSKEFNTIEEAQEYANKLK